MVMGMGERRGEPLALQFVERVAPRRSIIHGPFSHFDRRVVKPRFVDEFTPFTVAS